MSWTPSPSPSSPSDSMDQPPSPTPCKSILRRRDELDVERVQSSLQALKVDQKGRACCSKSVKFSENVDERWADDWDRSSCAVACPTYRDILELKQIQLELLPDRRGIIRDQYDFDDYGDGDVDRSSRCNAGGRQRRYLKRVPLELCPILPAAPAPTPVGSATPSPVVSPLHTPPQSLSPPPLQRPQPKALMTFLPILPPAPPPEQQHHWLTPPQTPTPLDLNESGVADSESTSKSHEASVPEPRSPPSSTFESSPHSPPPTPSIFTRKESPAKQHYNLLPIVPCSSPIISSCSSPPISVTPIHPQLLRGMSCAAASNHPIRSSTMTTPRRSTELSPSPIFPSFTIAYKAHATTI